MHIPKRVFCKVLLLLDSGAKPLRIASCFGYTVIVEILLLNNGAKIDKVEHQSSLRYVTTIFWRFCIAFGVMFSKLMFLNFLFNCISFLAFATNIMLATGSAGSYLDGLETIRITEAWNDVSMEWCHIRYKHG